MHLLANNKLSLISEKIYHKKECDIIEINEFIIKRADKDILIKGLENEFPIDCNYFGKDFSVLYFEKFYLRTSSYLLASIIINFINIDECEVVILTGGGGSGLMDVKFGSEKNINIKIKNFLEKLCKENLWIITERNQP